MITKHLRIKGRVQGVWYRAWTIEQATKLGLKGWVHNCTDGSVEALVHGPEEDVEQMITACRGGPPSAQVSDIEISDGTYDGGQTFEQRATC